MAEPQKLGTLIDNMQKIRVERAALAKKDKELEDKLNDLEKDVKERLLAEGMDKASGKLATASLKRSLVGNVKDWEKVYAYVKRSGNFQLFQRRLSDAAYREILEKKGADIPGIEQFNKIGLGLTALN